MLLEKKFTENDKVDLEFSTKIDNSVKDGKKAYFVVSLESEKISDCIGIDFKVRIQSAIRKSFESQQEYEIFVDKYATEENPFNIHVSNINKKIETPEMRKDRIIREMKALGLSADDLK